MPDASCVPDPIKAFVASGEIVQAVALARQLSESSQLDIASAQWLLAEARGWHAQELMGEQQAVCEIMLSFVPDHHEALHLLGHACHVRGEFAQAEAYYARALAAKPDYAFARLALAQLTMMRSQFVQGRGEYEARFDAVTEGSGPDWRGLPIARWRGENLAGKKIYVWPEQGLGDIVMFAGFLPSIEAQSPFRIALGMFPKLITLFQRSFPGIPVEPADDAMYQALAPSALEAFPQIERLAGEVELPFSLVPLKAAHDYVKRHGLFDYAAPLGDLMVHLLPGYMPARHGAYLKADAARVSEAQSRLAGLRPGRRIGISWHTTNRREWMRNIPLENWLPLLRSPGCHFVSLQHHADAQDIERFCLQHGCHITMDERTDFMGDAEGLAALIASVDEVITIDNSVVHLAGALGTQATVLLPAGYNYRWPEQKDGGTLWYRCVSTLRQSNLHDWQPVMAEMQKRLLARL